MDLDAFEFTSFIMNFRNQKLVIEVRLVDSNIELLASLFLITKLQNIFEFHLKKSDLAYFKKTP